MLNILYDVYTFLESSLSEQCVFIPKRLRKLKIVNKPGMPHTSMLTISEYETSLYNYKL